MPLQGHTPLPLEGHTLCPCTDIPLPLEGHIIYNIINKINIYYFAEPKGYPILKQKEEACFC
jgi:hypothetical protein